MTFDSIPCLPLVIIIGAGRCASWMVSLLYRPLGRTTCWRSSGGISLRRTHCSTSFISSVLTLLWSFHRWTAQKIWISSMRKVSREMTYFRCSFGSVRILSLVRISSALVSAQLRQVRFRRGALYISEWKRSCRTLVGLMMKHSRFSIVLARRSKPYLSARSSSSTAVCHGKKNTTMVRGTGYVYIIVRHWDQWDLRDLETRGPLGCSVPSAARALLGGPRVSKSRRSHWSRCLTFLDHG